MNGNSPEDIAARCRAIAAGMRRDMVRSAGFTGGHAHWGGSLSCAEILAVLYGAVLNCRDRSLGPSHRDRFVVSKGHAGMALYAALKAVGIIDDAAFQTYYQNGTLLSAHPVVNEALGIECTSGSLGMGLSLSVGLALAARRRSLPYRVYALLGDGETDEGSVWEAVMSASQFGLDNLTVVVDANGLQADGATDDIMSWRELDRRLAAFGFQVLSVEGHDCLQVFKALSASVEPGRPRALVAHTVKGKGISFMENDVTWHHRVLSGEQLAQARREVGLE